MNEIEVEEYYNQETWSDPNRIPFKDLTRKEKRLFYNSSGFSFWRLNNAWTELTESVKALLRSTIKKK